MYRCDRCGKAFAEPENKKLDYGWDWCCPICGSAVYHEFTHCANCGEEIAEEQAAFSLCADCEAAIKEHVLHELAGYRPHELAYILWMLGEEHELVRH